MKIFFSKRQFPVLICVSLLFLFIQSCKHTPLIDGEVTPIDTTGNPIDTGSTGIPCDPGTVYFSRQILPLLHSNCARSGCHDAQSRQEGIVLTDYQSVMRTGKIKPYNLNGSDLYEAITEDKRDKVMPPPPNPTLTSEQITLIGQWIQQGAKDLSCDADAGGCDTGQVTYQLNVKPILQNYCQGCHNASNASGGINLTTHAVVASLAQNGRLYGAVSHQPGYVAMPYGGSKLPDCTIKKIKVWVDAGAPDN